MSKEKNDLTLKIFAVIIAVVLWSYVMSEVNPTQTDIYKDIKITFNNLEALERQRLVLMEPKEATVSVKVSGTKTDLAKFSAKFSPKSIKAQVDLSGYSEGQFKVPVNVSIDQLSNIRIEKVEPQDILFTFDKLITRDKPVTIKTEGKLEPGYVLGDITRKVQSVLIKGPRSWVNEVADAVAIVNLDGRKEDIDDIIPINLVDDEGNDVSGVTKEPNVVDVTIPVFRTVTVPIELNLANEPPENYEITEINIKPSTIALKGNKNIVNLAFIQTKPIDINNLIGNSDVPVELELPENVSLLNPNEKVTISLKIEESFTNTFEYTLEEIDIRNLSDELSIDSNEYSKTIKIVVKGTAEDIQKLTKEDLEPYLDFDTLDEGTHKIYVDFNAPTGITVKEITPQPVEIKLNKES